MSEGWIKLHRRCLEHPCLQAFDAQGVWAMLLMLAAREPRRDRFLGQELELDRGQLALSVSAWCEKHGMTRKRMRVILASFGANGMVKLGQAKGQAFTLVTICNYAFYQAQAEGKGQRQGQALAEKGPIEQEELIKNTPTPNGVGGGGAPPPAAKAVLWAEMKRAIGGDPKKAGGLVGRWCRDHGEGAVFAAHFAAMAEQPADYVPWMIGKLHAGGPRPPPKPARLSVAEIHRMTEALADRLEGNPEEDDDHHPVEHEALPGGPVALALVG